MPCPHDAVTSFPRVFLCGDCSPNQDGDSAHYKLVRQRLCAPSRDRLSGSLASLPLPRTPGQRPLHGASLLGLSAPSPGTQADRHCLQRPLYVFTNAKTQPRSYSEVQGSGQPPSRAEWHLDPEVTFTGHLLCPTHREESFPGSLLRTPPSSTAPTTDRHGNSEWSEVPLQCGSWTQCSPHVSLLLAGTQPRAFFHYVQQSGESPRVMSYPPPPYLDS